MIISDYNLEKLREQAWENNKKIVFCSGSFDLCHAGHILFFEDCKKCGDLLIVAVGSDLDIKDLKGKNRPILNEHIRLKTIDSFKPVDYTFLQPRFPNKPVLFGLDVIFDRLRPDIYVINKDAFDINYRKKICKKYNVNLKILDRTCPKEYKNISTSKIIEKIKNV